MSIESAFYEFIYSKDFEQVVVSATIVAENGYFIYVELFQDGTWRILREVGNLYNSPGLIITIPALNDDEWHEDGNYFFDNVREYLVNAFDSYYE